jgi:wobble nucleotide-excising tRNase
MNGVASYKTPAALETDKKVNLVYGLNGTGKSILSTYLYEKENGDFSKCNMENLNNEDILVYNQKFIQDYFYESDNLKGIFTLSKEKLGSCLTQVTTICSMWFMKATISNPYPRNFEEFLD